MVAGDVLRMVLEGRQWRLMNMGKQTESKVTTRKKKGEQEEESGVWMTS